MNAYIISVNILKLSISIDFASLKNTFTNRLFDENGRLKDGKQKLLFFREKKV